MASKIIDKDIHTYIHDIFTDFTHTCNLGARKITNRDDY